jgi:hypothetical protein
MDVGTSTSATGSNSASSTATTGQTGTVETPSYAPEEKEEGIKTPEDTVEISDAGKKGKGHVKNKGLWNDFDMDAFKSGMRDKLMESINKSKSALKAAGVEFTKDNGDSILYNTSGLNGGKGVKAAEVPEYWNAENTSQRIVDFAMSFRGLAPELSDEEYIEKIRGAVQLGYSLAKKDLGSLPGPSAQLYNDTYNLTMKKFDDILAKSKQGAV